MKSFGFIILLVALSALVQSCSSMFSTAGGNTAGNDSISRFTTPTIVGTSNTPGTPRSGYLGEPPPGIRSTANSTGPSPSPNDTKTNSALAFETQKFIRLASVSKITETQLAQLGSSRSKNSRIKEYASRILLQQNRVGEDLKSLSISKDMAVVDLDQSASDELTGKLDKLNNAPDTQFDELFKKMILKEHRDAIRIFDGGSKFRDPAIASFSKKYLPLLKTQLQELESLK